MSARWMLLLVAALLSYSSGCCCSPCGGGACKSGPGCGPACNACCVSWCIPRANTWNPTENECGPDGCSSCACPNNCGILAALRYSCSCGKGCGETYWGEWISDPPDCCDPCDQCHGCWTGPHGYCTLGPCQRILAALHGFSYCPPPCCGPACGLCNSSCGGCGTCGSGGCATCGHSGGYEGDVIYDGGHHHPQNIMEENWDIPAGPKPVPGKPIHKAQNPNQPRVSKAMSPMGSGLRSAKSVGPANNRMVRQAAYGR